MMQEDQLNSLLDRVKEALAKLSPEGSVPGFDIGDPDIFTNTKFYFESKSEAGKYLKDSDGAAQSILVLREFISRMSEHQKMQLDRHGRYFDYPDEEFSELSVGKIAGMHGVSDSLKSVLSLFEASLKDEREEICEEIERYWTGLGRGKSWRANHVALRIAQMYYDENGETPTFGVDYNGNPSTLYTSVVSEVFGILDYEVNFKEPAKWARNTFIKQLEKGEIPHQGQIKGRETIMETFTKTTQLVKKIEGIIGGSIVYEPAHYPDMPENDEK